MYYPNKPIKSALSIANDYGSIQGDHHRAWVIDQMVMALCGCSYSECSGYIPNEKYEKWVAKHNDGEDGPNTYDWDKGIAP